MTQPYPAEAVRELNERADWLKSEYLKGGNYEILKAREDECRYLTKKFAALLSYVEGMRWKPISEAPRDGTRVLLFVPPYGHSTGHWTERQALGEGYFPTEGRWSCHSVLNKEAEPKYWLPLPPTPDSEG